MTMLKGIPSCLNPQLLSVLASMGHGDFIVLADANFPAASHAVHCPGGLIRADGLGIPRLLKAILKLMPLDPYTETPAIIMSRVPSDKTLNIPVRETYQAILNEAEGRDIHMFHLERFQFYQKAKSAYAIIATGETAMYGNIIIQKGVIPDALE